MANKSCNDWDSTLKKKKKKSSPYKNKDGRKISHYYFYYLKQSAFFWNSEFEQTWSEYALHSLPRLKVLW